MTSPTLWTLIAVQIALGAFDTIFHHELTQRLAWRAAQRQELKLHAARNLLYAALFATLGFAQVHGALAVLVIAVLATEVALTLVDFVGEDLTRKLPASERITHTLLAVNYGAILTLLLPVLIGWACAPTTVKPVYYGLWSVLAALAAAGTTLFALRDLAAARRAARMLGAPAEQLMGALARRHTVLVTGATGFIGRRLVEALAAGGHDVTALARDPAKAATLRPPFRLVTGLDQIADGTRFDAIVNLAGEPIADGLWTRTRRQRILRSRLAVTRDLVRLIARLDHSPAVLISASAVGWYGLRADEPLTESDADAGVPSFCHAVCASWEHTAMAAQAYGTRVVCLRIGLVLGTEGGPLSRMLTPFEFGLGGPTGSGRQWMSWIDRDDLVRLIAHVIGHPDLSGAVNATAPHPVRNAAFARELGAALRRPALLRMPASVLHRLGDFADELLLGGQRVLPQKAQASGFKFRHETLRSALAEMVGTRHRATHHRGVGWVERFSETHHVP